MTNSEPRILAINPGTRYIGMAFFQGPELREWGIKIVSSGSLKYRMSNVARTLSQLIDQFSPHVMVIKKLHPSRSSSNLNKAVVQMKDLAKQKSLKVYQYPLQSVEQSLSGGEKTNKRRLAEMVAETYPFLHYELKKEKTNRNPYHVRMFEAVALGLAYHNRLKETK